MDILSFYVGSRRHFSETSLTGTDHTMSCGFCRVSFDKLINDSVRHNSSFRERARSRNTYFPFCGSFEYLMVFLFSERKFSKDVQILCCIFFCFHFQHRFINFIFYQLSYAMTILTCILA